MKIHEIIPVGHENAIDRKEIARRTGLSDRKNRALIEEAWIKENVAIINIGNGYYIVDQNDPYDVRELMQYLGLEGSRRASISKKLEIGYRILRGVVCD
ncbi:hypothetical protein ACTQ6A_02845 [Lachnospiraceae bacterium LCP25S3_G4]